ncbi:MAG: hypothetical protein ABI831_09230 [Betaproteobacteria bacterium]
MKVTGKAVQVKASVDALTQLTGRFARWHAGRKLGMRIPAQLWAAAVEMVAEHGACRVAGELNLDYDMLKQRVALAGGKWMKLPERCVFGAPATSAGGRWTRAVDELGACTA